MTVASDTFTPNLQLRKIAADRKVWAALMDDNLTILDAVISSFFSTSNMQGVWENSHAYAVDDAVVDSTTAVVYVCAVAHTSAGLPTTFAEDRAAHESYWVVYSAPATNRGAWSGPGTTYSRNDFVLAGGTKYAFCLTSHTSTSSFDNDIVSGYWSVIIDLSVIGSLVLPVLTSSADAGKFVVTNGAGTAYIIVDSATAMSMLSGILPVSKGGTGVTSSSGSGAVLLGTNPAISDPTITGGMTYGGKDVGATPTGNSGSNLVLSDGATLTGMVHQTGSVGAGVVVAIGAIGAGTFSVGVLLPAAQLVAGALANGMTATTQNQASNDTKIATDAYADRIGVQQVVSYSTGAVATGTTLIPFDDTIPQSTEGDQYLTVTITPKFATSKLIIDVDLHCSLNVINGVLMALFQDSAPDAIKTDYLYFDTAFSRDTMHIRHVMTSGTTSPITFKVRAGPDTSGTLTVNGANGARYFGGTLQSSITIMEVGA